MCVYLTLLTAHLKTAKVTNQVLSTTILKQKDHIVLQNTREKFEKRKSNRTIGLAS